jgi:hypothetical protein
MFLKNDVVSFHDKNKRSPTYSTYLAISSNVNIFSGFSPLANNTDRSTATTAELGANFCGYSLRMASANYSYYR